MQPFHSLRSVCFFFSLLGFHMITTASPLAPRATYNCTDLKATYDSRCWLELGMVDFLSDPAAEWGPKRSPCAPNDDNCCNPDEPWSTCMLRIVHGGKQDCTQINPKNCTYQGFQKEDLPPTLRPKYQYAAYTILAVNEFFNNWASDLQQAVLDTYTVAASISADIDPQRKAKLSYNALVSASLASVPFLSSIYGQNLEDVSPELRLTSETLTKSLRNAPQVAKTLFSSNATAEQEYTIRDLYSTDKTAVLQQDIKESILASLNSTLKLIMTDVLTFAAFTSSGAYVNTPRLSFGINDPTLNTALKTYITTTALSANGYIAGVKTYQEIQSARDACLAAGNDAASCVDKSDYYDPLTKLGYSMGSASGAPAINVRETIIDKKYTMWEALFAAPYACADAGLFDAGMLVNVGGLEGADVSCVGRLAECKSAGAQSLENQHLQECPTGWKAFKG